MKREYGLIALCLSVAAVLAVLVGCTPKAGFDQWIAKQGYTVKHEPVPCAVFPRNCGGTGQTDIVNKIIYLDDARIAIMQASQNLRDPSLDVATYVLYHEYAHVADAAAGFVEGIGDLQFEHAAQCGAELLLGRTFDFFQPAVYWDCPDSEVAKTRWIWTARGII